jgi:hypothetical protein
MMVASIFTACPSCERRVSEITAAGICPQCKVQFAKEHSRHLGPPRWEARDFEYRTHGAPSAFDEGGRCGTTDPEATHDDDPAPTPHDEAAQLASDALRRVLTWAWSNGKRPISMTTAFRKFISLSATIAPDLCGNLTFRELAAKMDCTRAILSRHSLSFSREMGNLKFRRSRPASARLNMSVAARKHAPCHPRKGATKPKGAGNATTR